MHITKSLILAAILLSLLSWNAIAQEDKSAEAAAKAPPATYRLQYTVSEVADGKRINSRTYDTLVLVNPSSPGVNWSQIRMGNRVPFTGGEKGAQYLDVGVSIDCGLRHNGDGMALTTRFDLSSLAPDEKMSIAGMPVLRSVRFTSEQNLVVGQKVPISGGDDVNTNRRFELEVLATRVK